MTVNKNVDVEEVSPLALRLGLLIEEWFAEMCHEFGITLTQAAALRCLSENGSCRQSQLADYLNCDASNVTAVADRLESLGAIRRKVSNTDRRVKLLELTPAGASLVANLWQRSRLTSPVAVLSPQERSTLASLVSKMLEAAGASMAIRHIAERDPGFVALDDTSR
ncbi:MAG: MarR family transcriptional regulator [Actinomycetota bacterium]|nr:MarR family transcriptional regulator [Actinomycetota bacterium]